eukprot:1919673-Pyramimonas_sp.AAC.2
MTRPNAIASAIACASRRFRQSLRCAGSPGRAHTTRRAAYRAEKNTSSRLDCRQMRSTSAERLCRASDRVPNR